MENVWLASALWIGLALASALISIRLALSVALIEIMVGAFGGQPHRAAADTLGQLPRRFRRDPTHVPCGRGGRLPMSCAAMWSECRHRYS